MAILTHGDNSKCPQVQAGTWNFCAGHTMPDAGYGAVLTLAQMVVASAEAVQREYGTHGDTQPSLAEWRGIVAAARAILKP